MFQSRQHAVRPHRRFGPRPSGANFSGLLSHRWHCRRGGFRREVHSASISLRPFAPRALPRFLAPMDALTPERPDVRGPFSDTDHRTCLRPGLLVSCIKPSDRSASNHLLPPPGPGLVSTRSLPRGLPTASLPRDQSVVWASPFTRRLAATTGRIEFVILRTSRSPPIALHPLSRGRSYFRLQSSNPTSTRTFTLLIRYTSKRTSKHTPCAVR